MRLIDANRLKDDLSELPMMSNWGEAFVPKLIDEQLTIDPETLPLVCKLRKELEDTKQKARAACSLCRALAESNMAQTICDQCPLKGVYQ